MTKRMIRTLRKLPLFACAAGMFLVSSRANAALIVTPPVEVQTLTHIFTPASNFPFPQPASSRDYFDIGSGYTGGGAFSVSSISNGDTATLRLQAPTGMKFVVHDPNAQLGLDLYFQAGGDVSTLSGGTVAFENLTGSPPLNTYSFLAVGNSGNVIKAQLQFQAVGLVEFTALDITIPVQSSPPGGGRDFGAVQSNSSPAFYAFANSSSDETVLSIDAIPEPGSLALFAVAGVGLLRLRKRQNQCRTS